jgi:hypothetical protein
MSSCLSAGGGGERGDQQDGEKPAEGGFVQEELGEPWVEA